MLFICVCIWIYIISTYIHTHIHVFFGQSNPQFFVSNENKSFKKVKNIKFHQSLSTDGVRVSISGRCGDLYLFFLDQVYSIYYLVVAKTNLFDFASTMALYKDSTELKKKKKTKNLALYMFKTKGLKEGISRRSSDNLGEKYAMLLATYCNTVLPLSVNNCLEKVTERAQKIFRAPYFQATT